MNTKYLASINSYLIILASFLVSTTLQVSNSKAIDIDEALRKYNADEIKKFLEDTKKVCEDEINDILNHIFKNQEKYKKNELVDILTLSIQKSTQQLKPENAPKLLRRACISNNEDLVHTLLQHKKDYAEESLITAAFICAENDYDNSLKVLFKSPLLKFPLRNANNESILTVASLNKSVNVVRFLLKSGKKIEVNYQHEKPQGSTEIKDSKTTALIEACIVRYESNATKALTIVKLLLENNANPNLLNADGQGAFTKALVYRPDSPIARTILAHDQFDWKIKYNNNTILHRVMLKLEGIKKSKKNYINNNHARYKKLINEATLKIKELEELLKIILQKNIVDPQAINKDGKKAIDLTQDEKIKKQLKEAEEKYKKAHPNQGGKPKFNIFQSKGAKIAVVMVLITLSLGAIGGVAFLIMKKKSNNE